MKLIISYLNNLVNLICGSYECIKSNITGFKEYTIKTPLETYSIWAGHMDHHGPNIVFIKDPDAVIAFIDKYWDLTRKTDGLSKENK